MEKRTGIPLKKRDGQFVCKVQLKDGTRKKYYSTKAQDRAGGALFYAERMEKHVFPIYRGKIFRAYLDDLISGYCYYQWDSALQRTADPAHLNNISAKINGKGGENV